MLTLSDIQKAHQRIKPHIHQTPVLSSTLLNQWLGHEIYFKAECLQKVGAFKARGACNTLLWLKEQGHEVEEIVCSSSGNHAQAVAWSSAKLGMNATIYMPTNVSKVKSQASRDYGAEVVFCESRQQADALVAEAAQQEGVHWVPPFNHEQVIAGQGTAVLEAFEQLNGTDIDAVFAPCGGGGLLSGTVVATRELSANTKVCGVEPLMGNDAAESLRQGAIVKLDEQPNTMADGAKTLSIGDLTFPYLKQLHKMYEVEEQDIAYWSQWLSHLLKLNVEPTSAMNMGAVVEYLKQQTSPQKVLVMLTGGNIDATMHKRIWADDHLTVLPRL